MTSWTIKQRVVAGFSAMLAIVVFLAIVSLLLLQRIKANLDTATNQAIPSLLTTARLLQLREEAQSATFQHLTSPVPAFKEAAERRIAESQEETTKLLAQYQALADTDGMRKNVAMIVQLTDTYVKARAKVLALSRAGKYDDAIYAYHDEFEPGFFMASKKTQDLFERDRAIANELAQRSDRLVAEGRVVVVVLIGAALVLGIALALGIAGSLNRVLTAVARRLEVSSQEVDGAAEQVSTASRSLAAGAVRQTAEIERVGTSLEQIGGLTRDNAGNAQSAQNLSRQARSAAENGTRQNEAMQQAIEGIQEAGVELKDAMDGIKASSDDISKIIRTIDGIALQTNILALNASVEAVRAGAAGKSFSVVAEEIRTLSQRSAAAARETAGKIEAALAQSGRGIAVNQRVIERIDEIAQKADIVWRSLEDIVEKVRQVDGLIEAVATSSRDQSDGLDRISSSVVQVDQVTRRAASGAQETAAHSTELSNQTGELRGAIGDLLRLVGEKRKAADQGISIEPGHRELPEFGKLEATRSNAPIKSPGRVKALAVRA